MLQLARLVYWAIAPTLAGVFVVVALVAGYGSAVALLLFAALGLGAALPLSLLVARAMT